MDRISGLSDELLVKILLLVPTKVAVSTSILSKRWEYLWMWMPKLEYSHRFGSEPECKTLQCFLDKNMPLHRAPVIETFRLDLYCVCLKPENISMWVLTAVSHCLRELDITRGPHLGKPVILPSNLFACKSLVILKLEGRILLDVPRMVSLPSLKTLKLQRVRFLTPETLQRLLSNCPILENLMVFLHDEDITRKLLLTLVVPSLQSLSLYIPYNNNNSIYGYRIETPSLKYFKLLDYNDNANDHYCLVEFMPNLIEAHLDINLPDLKSIIGSITSVKRLTICSQTMLDEGFVFNQLEYLEVCLCREHSSNQLVRLLNASPNLQGLRLFYMKGHHTQHKDDWNQPSTVPECLLSSLQSLSWLKYKGKPQEREIAVYILKHALQLKTATIKSSSKSAVQKLEILKELALSSGASATCQLNF